MAERKRNPAIAILWTLSGALCLAFGCRTTRDTQTPIQAPEPVRARPATRATPPATPTPQANAARALMDEGKRLFESGRIDDALSRLERAASLNPRNGEGHYWLAEVWLAKGNSDQAQEHHKLAKRYLAGDAEWSDRLKTQQAAIH